MIGQKIIMMVPLLLPLLVASAAAFTAPNPRVALTSYPTRMAIGRSLTWHQRLAASDGDDVDTTPPASSSSPTRRRRRKDGNVSSPPSLVMESKSDDDRSGMISDATASTTRTMSQAPSTASSSPKADVLVMKVRDIRDVVSGMPDSPTYDEVSQAMKDDAGVRADEIDDDDDDDDNDDELADDEEWEYYDVDDDGREIVSSSGMRRPTTGGDARKSDDPIDELLADARRMRANSPSPGRGRSRTTTGGGAKEIIFEVISAIVTIDFFVVLALLVWFLAGIFCSYVLKDDTVQIAFNMNFERLTQPALGVLMIGSVAGAAFGKEDESD
ncbi:hypothetical protein ACHAXA_011590 [Cyclostephanos tholiformis]|uniref:Uncharacterized protein n=1 Tax=Cyclostephanos tholiformis TaxID=382380 RepID=A0ABD3SHG4_9STRA